MSLASTVRAALPAPRLPVDDAPTDHSTDHSADHSTVRDAAPGRRSPHPRRIGWVGTTALALGGSNQSLFLVSALVVAQGTAAVPLLAIGLLLAWMAAPGWTELVLMWPDRVGGISATCAEAFRPYSPVLANLTGVCYWWGWVPTCGLTALLASHALHAWTLSAIPVTVMACVIVLLFTALNLCGVIWATRVATAIGALSFTLAVVSTVGPAWSGRADWHQAFTFHLIPAFHGPWGTVTSAMAGLYLIGFAAPAFEAATCHVGETKDPVRNVPRAIFASGATASIYFIAIPVVWLGVIGPTGLAGNGEQLVAGALGPTFAPLFGGLAKGAATAFLVTNMLHGTLQPLAGAARTMAQLSEDGLVPRMLARRNRHDAPWFATMLTAACAITFLIIGDPVWLIAAANLAYLIGIALPNIAVFLLRRHEPDRERPWRAPRGTIVLGVLAAGVWLVSTVLGFEQFGLPTVLLGIGLCYAASALYWWRRWTDRIRSGQPRSEYTSLHAKLTGSMLAVLALDGAGYLIAVQKIDQGREALVVVLSDLFVLVALLTITVGLVLPGMIGHGITQVAMGARRLARGTLGDFTRAMSALGAGDLDAARARIEVERVIVPGRDQVREMADSFNSMQDEIARAADSLDAAREQMRLSRDHLQWLADRDPLTGLRNRRALEAALVRDGLERRDGAASALVVVDLDNFKDINDSRGHTVGDEVLRQVGALLADKAGPSDVAARLGGDEFALLLDDGDAVRARVVAQTLVDGVRELVVLSHGRRVRVTASAGIAVAPGGARTQLLVDADVAMYDAKERGRDRVCVASWSDPQQQLLKGRASRLDALRDALATDRFVLHAQPILDLHTGEVGRHELLLRLIGDDGRLIAPGAFLPEAERNGLVTAIDRWVVRRTFALLRAAAESGEQIALAANLSGSSIGDAALLELLESEAATLPRSAAQPLFEVTETAAISDLAGAREFAARLSGLGIALALDDFGAGYGSFHYLKHLPFEHLKIDGDFVVELAHRREDQIVVDAIVRVAREMRMTVTAEFVEDAQTLDLLAELGVHHAQGYHIGRPVPIEEAFPWLGVPRIGSDLAVS
ncbi:MAG TPA: amino acid permease [Mycobacteriales bacterium]|nr:amino acid permease [Mycobacteriales bacterium]